jgi:hypothetical protein
MKTNGGNYLLNGSVYVILLRDIKAYFSITQSATRAKDL